MIIIRETIDYYLNRLRNDEYFSVAGYSDAEWYCMMCIRIGDKTALGQVLSLEHGHRLLDVLLRRGGDPNFLLAIPQCLFSLPSFPGNSIERFLENHGINGHWYERDMVTDELAAHPGGLKTFIRQLQAMDVVVIGNEMLRGLEFLGYTHFVEISTPNLHLEGNGIELAVEKALGYGKPAVYLVSAGVSAAVIIDKLHGNIPDSFFIDCGSIWDAFVGIGGQREWRAALYRDPKGHQQWIKSNLE